MLGQKPWQTCVYQKCSAPKITNRMNERIHIQKHGVWMMKRKKAAVIRYAKFSIGSEEYYYSLLLLFLPHQSEESLIFPCQTAKDAFQNKYGNLDLQIAYLHLSFVNELENSMRRIRLAQSEIPDQQSCQDTENDHLFETLANLGDLSEDPSVDDHLPPLPDLDVFDQCELAQGHELEACIMSASDYGINYSKLLQSQKKIIDYIQEHFKRSRNRQ